MREARKYHSVPRRAIVAVVENERKLRLSDQSPFPPASGSGAVSRGFHRACKNGMISITMILYSTKLGHRIWLGSIRAVVRDSMHSAADRRANERSMHCPASPAEEAGLKTKLAN